MLMHIKEANLLCHNAITKRKVTKIILLQSVHRCHRKKNLMRYSLQLILLEKYDF